jgi:hypothetical protein
VKVEVERGDCSSLGESRPLTGFASFTERATDKGRTLLAGLFDRVERLDLLTGQAAAPSRPLPVLHGYSDWQGKGCHVSAWSAEGKIAFVQSFDPSGDHQPRGERDWIEPDVDAIDIASGERLGATSEPRVLADLNGDGVPEIITLAGVFDVTTGERERYKGLWTPKAI